MSIHPTTSADMSTLESTKYALLRRLTFVFRHDLVGSLQPLNIMCQVMRLKLQRTPVDVPAVGDCIDKTSVLIAKATQSSLEVIAWLSGDDTSTVTVDAGVENCIRHLASSLSFRGFEISHVRCPLDFKVNAMALREVLAAALIAASDHAHGRSKIDIRVLAITDRVEVTLQMHHGTNDSSADIDAYRLIQWDEVKTLAHWHGVGLQRDSDQFVKIQFNRPPIDDGIAISQ